MSDGTIRSPDDESLQKLRDLVEAVNREDYEQVVALCKAVTLEDTNSSIDNSVQAVQTAIQETYVYALLHCQKYDEAVAVMDQLSGERMSSSRVLQTLQAYAAYKQKKYQQAVHLASHYTTTVDHNNNNNHCRRTLQHIQAQSWHHLADSVAAANAYTALWIDAAANNNATTEETIQIWTNLLAVRIANHAIPYCCCAAESSSSSSVETEELVQSVSTFLQGQSSSATTDDNEYPYDLAYNVATLQLLTTPGPSDRVPWLRLLDTAAAAVRRTVTEDELAAELGPIETNRALFRRVFWNMTAAGSSSSSSDFEQDFVDTTTTAAKKNGASLEVVPATTALQMVRQVNHALLGQQTPVQALQEVLTGEPDATKLTVLQRRIWYYNRAAMQLQAGKLEDCRATCQRYFLSLSHHKSKKKKSTEGGGEAAAAVYNSPDEQLFWESRATVLVAHCVAKEGENPGDILDACVKSCQALPESNVRDHALTYTLLHRAILVAGAAANSMDAKIKALEELPESIRSKPAVVATKASLYHAAGDKAKAAQLLQTVKDDQAVADFAMSQGNYQQAAELYEKAAAASNDSAVKARWVRALSYTDPDKAVALWSEMAPDLVESDDDDDVNGAELEAKELRLKSTMVRRTQDASAATVGATKKSKKSHAAVLRRRARRREAYLAELEAKGTYKPGSTVPDPERWLPKYERSNARRRKNRGQHKGAQGGVSEKDALKLDVVARQAARASGEADQTGRSTAHMTVSGGARKGKSSKRR